MIIKLPEEFSLELVLNNNQQALALLEREKDKLSAEKLKISEIPGVKIISEEELRELKEEQKRRIILQKIEQLLEEIKEVIEVLGAKPHPNGNFHLRKGLQFEIVAWFLMIERDGLELKCVPEELPKEKRREVSVKVKSIKENNFRTSSLEIYRNGKKEKISAPVIEVRKLVKERNNYGHFKEHREQKFIVFYPGGWVEKIIVTER